MSAKICPQCGREYAETEKFCTEDGATLRNTSGAEGLINSVVADRYLVLKKLGEGGMGQVYLAEHVRMKRKCALKVMHPAMGTDPDAVQRFSREAANAAQIIHPNVAAVFDFGETSDRLIYLAMEFVEGDSLSALVSQNQALPAPRAAVIAAQAAEGLAAAHELGIVHRDLKPDNIMISRDRSGNDLVKVVDFGIAKAMGSGDGQKVTRTGFVIGTPEYMSPEQLVGDAVDGRSDIYSLALVAFNMFTGTLPFPSRTSQEAMIARLTQTPKTLAEMRGDVPWPPQLQDVMNRALARDPNERYASAKEFGRDLAESMRNMPNLTAEQLGTQMQAAVQAAKLAGASAARATPTMAVAPKGLGRLDTAPPAAMAPRTQVLGGGTTAAPAPATSGGGSKVAIGAGIGVLALAGVAYAMFGGAKTPAATDTAAAQPPAASQPADPSTQAPVQTVASADPQSTTTAAPTPAVPQPDPRQAPARPAPTQQQPVTTRLGTTAPVIPAPRPGPQQGPVTQPVQQPIQQQPTYTAPSTPATQPAAQPTGPAFDVAAATAEVKSTVGGYVGAFAQRRTDALRRFYPGLGSDWDELLNEKSVKDLKARLTGVSDPDFDAAGNSATTTFSMVLDFKSGGQAQSQSLKYLAKLRRDGGSWKIVDLDSR